jgi:RHS repeat-associated protein
MAGGQDFYVLKMSADGSKPLAFTYLGGAGSEFLASMALDGAGNIYLLGSTTSSGLKTTTGTSFQGGQTDFLVAKLDAGASKIQLLTYLGGSAQDSPYGVTVTADGNTIWVAGNTSSTNYPTTASALQKTNAGQTDAVFTRLDGNGAIQASTYLGGPGADEGYSVVLAGGTPVFVALLTTSQYDKASTKAVFGGFALQGIRLAAASASSPELALQTSDNAASQITSSTIFTSPDGSIKYVGDTNCTLEADGTTVVCTGSAFPVDETGNPRSAIVAAQVDTGSSGGGSGGGTTSDLPFVPSMPRRYSLAALPDPVDGGTGQFYDTLTDLKLGGPMGMSFYRYYSSTLSSGGFTSALGTNWMSNFDVTVAVSTTTAKALLFGGQVINFTKNGSAWQVSSPLDVVYQFQSLASTFKLMDPLTARVYTFDSTGALIKIEDRNGNGISITRGPNGPISVTDGLGRTLSFTYTGKNLTKVQDQTGRAVVFNYTGALLTSSVDARNQTWQYSYTGTGSFSGLMTKEQYPLGARTTQTYDAQGRVTSQTDAGNNTLNLAYSASGTTITDPLGALTKQTFDTLGDVTGFTDPQGSSAAVTYDSSNRRASITDKNGKLLQYTYHAPTGKLASQTNAQGDTMSFSYTAQSQGGFTFYPLTKITYRDGTSVTLAYDGSGNLISRTDRDGGVTSYSYDSNGRLVSVTSPKGGVTTLTYNADFTVATLKDPLGNVTTYGYDALKRVNKITEANGSVTNLAYDEAGQAISVKDPSGATKATAYNADGLRSSWTDGAGSATTFAYTPTAKVDSMTDPLGGKRAYAYDALDRIKSITDPTGIATNYEYDAIGLIKKISNPAGPLRSLTYDKEGRIASVTDGSNRTWTYQRDGDGRLTGLLDPASRASGFSYDKNGNLTRYINPLGGTVNYARDAVGRVTGITVGASITSTLQRDSMGLIAAYTNPNGNKWTNSYDTMNRPTGTTDPLGNTWSVTYQQNRVAGATFPLGTVAITTDANGRITKRAFSDGTTINAAYDARGLLSSADVLTIERDKKGQPTKINGIAVGLDSAGRATSFSYAAGKTVTYGYDAAGRVSTVTDWVGGKTAITYEGAGRIASVTYPNGVTNTYTYGDDGRVSKIAMGSLGSISITRNGTGRVTSEDRSLPALPKLAASDTKFTYDSAEQMTGGATYDKMGRTLTQNGYTYTWNLAGQLKSFSDGKSTTNLTYDGLAEMASLTNGAVTRNFAFNHLTHLPSLAIVKQGAADLRYYVYLPDGSLLYSVEASGNTRKFYHFDQMGNTAFLTDDSGKVTDTYAISPYGDVADHVGTTDNPFTWGGQMGIMQEAPGLYYLRSRHYDAVAGRFLSRDNSQSIDPRSGTPYAYAEGNPMLLVDPWGNDPEEMKAFYVMLENKLTDSYNRGKINGFAYIIWTAILSAGYDHADLDLSQLFELLWPPDPPPPPDPPAPPPPAPPPPPPAPALVSTGKSTPTMLRPPTAGTGLLPGVSLIGQDANSLIGQDANSLIGQDANSLIGQGLSGIVGHGGLN